MTIEIPDSSEIFEKLSVEERKKSVKEILDSPIGREGLSKNLKLICWIARQVYLDGEIGGSGHLKMAYEDLLAQDIPEMKIRSSQLIKGVFMLRYPADLETISDEFEIPLSDIPEGVYKNVNIFENNDGNLNRKKFFNEAQSKLWNQREMFQEDEGMVYHPIFEDDVLVAVKLYWQGHRSNLHVRSISIFEIQNLLNEGTKINLADYSMIRK